MAAKVLVPVRKERRRVGCGVEAAEVVVSPNTLGCLVWRLPLDDGSARLKIEDALDLQDPLKGGCQPLDKTGGRGGVEPCCITYQVYARVCMRISGRHRKWRTRLDCVDVHIRDRGDCPGAVGPVPRRLQKPWLARVARLRVDAVVTDAVSVDPPKSGNAQVLERRSRWGGRWRTPRGGPRARRRGCWR